jgi:hypothetical protein
MIRAQANPLPQASSAPLLAVLAVGAATLLALFLALVWPPQVVLAALFLVMSVTTALGAAWFRWGTVVTLPALFFLVGAGHAMFGFLSAQASSETIWMETFADRAYEVALLVVAVGLLAAAAGYAVGLFTTLTRWERGVATLEVSEKRLLWGTRLIVLAGIALMTFFAMQLGYAPLLSDAPSAARYLTQALSAEARTYEWFLNRAMDFLSCGLPLLLFPQLRERGWGDRLLAVAGGFAFLIPLRRANPLSVVFLLMMFGLLRHRRRWLPYLSVAPGLVLVYVLTQVVFLQFLGFETDATSYVVAAGSGLPEVRDLGWMIALLDGKWLNGQTLLQPFVPLPSFLSEFSQNASMRAITTRLIGLDAEGTTGGLRVTLAGEGYLNFGYAGTVAVMSLFGFLLGRLDQAMQIVRRAPRVAPVYLISLVFIWLCFWLYLAGSPAAATVKAGILIVAALLLCAQPRFGDEPAPAGRGEAIG